MYRVRTHRLTAFFCVVAACYLSGCGPQPPKVLLDAPADYPATLDGRRLFHTPNAFIYARNETDAGEADRWVKAVGDYIRRKHGGELDKGLILIMDPQDRPLVDSLDAQAALEQDPSLMVTQPRRPKSVEEIRQTMSDEGIPEKAAVRGASLPLTRRILQQQGIDINVPWAVSAPSEELAREVGVEMGVGLLRKKRPALSEEDARSALSGYAATLAKPLKIVRGHPVFVLWVQRQPNWTDDHRREAIREQIRDTFRSNWLPTPKDDDLQW